MRRGSDVCVFAVLEITVSRLTKLGAVGVLLTGVAACSDPTTVPVRAPGTAPDFLGDAGRLSTGPRAVWRRHEGCATEHQELADNTYTAVIGGLTWRCGLAEKVRLSPTRNPGSSGLNRSLDRRRLEGLPRRRRGCDRGVRVEQLRRNSSEAPMASPVTRRSPSSSDEARGVKLISYAVWWIRLAIGPLAARMSA
jgi:hypothetical protein